MLVQASASPPPDLPGEAGWRPLLGFVVDLLIAFAVLIFASVLGGMVWAAARLVSMAPSLDVLANPARMSAAMGQPGVLAQIGIGLGAMLVTALAVYFLRRPALAVERAASWRAARRPTAWGWAALAGVVAFAASLLLGWAMQHAGLDAVPSNQVLIGQLLHSQPWTLFALVVLFAPAYEELLFRRVLFGRLWAAGRPWLGVLLSSLAFALMHEVPGVGGNSFAATTLLLLGYTLMGAIFACVYRHTGTLWAAIGAHAINNLLACLVLLATQ